MALFLISFLATAALLLPMGIELAILPLGACLLFLSKIKVKDLKSFSGTDIKTLGGALAISFSLLLYFVINCYRRYDDLNITIALGAGLILFLLSLPFTLQIVSFRKILAPCEKTIINEDKSMPRLFSLAVGFLTIGLLSQSSPLYPMNNWSDANCFFTLGRGEIKGALMYRDIFDHKGPLLYLIHSLAAVITPHSFFGMFIIQAVLCSVTHRFLFKITQLFTVRDRTAIFLSVPAMFLIYSCNAYFYGDSAEELLLPFMTMGIYVFFKSFRKKSDLTSKDMVFLGLGAASAFWIKFTLCGFWIAAIIYLIVRMIRERKAKTLISKAAWFFVPCIGLSVPILILFAATGTIRDLLTVYFYNNIFGYQSLEGGIPLVAKIPYSLILTFMKLDGNRVLAALIVSAVLFLSTLKDKRFIAFYLTTFFITSFFVFFGDSQMFYYIFAVTGFAIPGVAPWVIIIKKALDRVAGLKLNFSILILALVSFCVYSFAVSCSTYEIFSPVEELPSYVFASYMDTEENVSILCYDFPDTGFYTAARSVPTERYYCYYNLDPVLPESADGKKEAVAQGRVEYVITMNNVYDFEGYDLIASADLTEVDFNNNVGTDTFFLYRRK